jgi:hypothetical protein
MYNVVTGTMQVMRFMSGGKRKEMVDSAKAAFANTKVYGASSVAVPDKAAGAASGATTKAVDYSPTPSISEESVDAQIAMFSHLDPMVVLLSETFDIDLEIAVPTSTISSAIAAAKAADSTKADSTITTGFTQPNFEYKPWLRISQCRLASGNVNISMGQLLNEPVSFQGLLLTPFDQNTANTIFSLDAGMNQVS